MTEYENNSSVGMIKEMDTSSVLKVRLDTTSLMQQFEIFLTGKVESIAYDDNNKPYITLKQIAPPLANERGQQWILNKLRMIVNPSTVQANFQTKQDYYIYVNDIWSSLIYNLMVNMHVWGIDENNYNPIIDNLMDVIRVFMTRPLDNKERESYINTMKIAESSTLDNRGKGGGFSLTNPFRGN